MNRKIIQDIIINKTSRFEPRYEEANLNDGGEGEPASSSPRNKILGLAFLLGLGGLFWVGSAYTQVNLKITPRSEIVRLDDTFSAAKNAGASGIRYEIMKIEEEAALEVASAGIKKVDKKASGRIIIYNNFGSQAQRFIAGTRFQAKDGKIYKIENAVTVPGYGSTEAKVIAAESGAEYNIGLTDFTIPGLKGSPRYDKFYARSKTAMTGGLKGEIKVAKESDMEEARKKLELLLKEKVALSAKSKLPEGFIFYADGQYFDFAEVEGSGSGATSTLEVKARAKLDTIILDKKDLAFAIGKRRISGFSGEEVEVRGVDGLAFNLLNKDKFDSEKDTQITFRLKGEAKLVWGFDHSLLTRKLVSLPKKDYQAALGDFPSIDRAEAVFRPFWARTFPSTPKRIKVELLDLP